MRTARSLVLLLAIPFLMASMQSEDVTKNNVYSKVTQDQKLSQALDSLNGTSGEWAKKAILGNNLSNKPIKISFKNLGEISAAYANFDALGWKDSNGQLYIYINQKHKSAPAEALGTILCHEAIHQDEYSSIEEETFGWTYEANVWKQMKDRNPQLEKVSSYEFPLVNRLEALEKMLINANYTNREIKEAVSTNPGYKGLPLVSPGFNGKDIKPAVLKKFNADKPNNSDKADE